MTRIRVHSELRYDVQATSGLAFAVLATTNRRQQVDDERFTVTPATELDRIRFDPSGHEVVRMSVEPGPLTVTYDATVDVRPFSPRDSPGQRHRSSSSPATCSSSCSRAATASPTCSDGSPSRCSARSQPGFERVTGICNWIWEHLSYVPGSTDGSTTAIDVLVGAAGVCRDYAHLAITFCRALGIPARYVSGYAVDLQPPDFHGFFEAFLAGEWYLFDATRMVPIDGLVRIATGRDAADVAFAAIAGGVELVGKDIVVIDLDRTGPYDPSTSAGTRHQLTGRAGRSGAHGVRWTGRGRFSRRTRPDRRPAPTAGARSPARARLC